MQIDISIIIPTKNAGEGFDDGLSSIFRQKTNYTYEVIVIDSGSTDRTLDIIAQYPTQLIIIKPEEFGHGKTRNLGARLATGKYLVFLTQDALPADEKWLDFLLRDIASDDEIAGAYSRTTPRSNCDPFEARYIAQAWGDKNEIKEICNYKKYTKADKKKIVFFSNISSCIQKDIWERFPFSENIIMAEDQDWSKRVLEAGYKIAYEPESLVYHSHTYTLKQLFKRYYDAGTAHKQVFRDNNNVYLPLIPVFAILVSILDLKFMWRRRYKLSAMVRWMPKALVRHLIEAFGFWRGLHAK
ncbi:rhamnosyltransferase [Methanophagales archaeon]|nr:rhamnosyltransferase [Methanophagales archaeon]